MLNFILYIASKYLKKQESFVIWILKQIAQFKTIFILNKKRRKELKLNIFNELKSRFYGYEVYKNAKSIGKDFYCSSFCNVNQKTILGDFVNFNGMRMEGDGEVNIGNYFHSGTECLIITRSHDYDNSDKIPYDPLHHIYKKVTIGDFVWLGSRVMILPGTTIGEGAIIQGGSVVHGTIPPYAIAGGNPAKVFKYRDIEHFKKLKCENKFY